MRDLSTRALFLATAAVAVALLGRAPPARCGDPELMYSTITTDHFHIHYHQGLEELAREVAAIAEEVHEELTILFGWKVKGRTEVVVRDPTDAANGWARAAPRPQIMIYATTPTLDASLASHDHWIRTLFTHEYTHVIHLQMHGGVARVINAVFGDVYLPNQMQPRWFIEGMAILDETYGTTAGRIRSANYRMSVRTAALEGDLLTLDRLSNSTRQFPRGHNDYIYGAMFVNWLKDRYGTERLVEICRAYGSAPIPYGLNRTFRRVLGTPLTGLYEEWRAEVLAEARVVEAEVRARGETASRRLTRDGEYKGRPIWSADGRDLILAIADGRQRTGLFRVPADGGERERLALAAGDTRVAGDRAGRLFFNRAAPVDDTYFLTDVFVLERPGDEPRRLTRGLRARELDVSPRGDLLALTRNRLGRTSLVLADDRGRVLRTLLGEAPSRQVYDPAFSPDGRFLAAVVREDHAVDVVIVDLESGAVERVTDDRALDRSPAFDPSGRYLLFASDRTGIDNVFAWDREARTLLQVTDVVSGAAAPAVSPDGRELAFLRYHSDGWDLHVAAFDPATFRPAAPPPPAGPDPAPIPPAPEAEPRRYNPLPSLLPRHWMLGLSASAEEAELTAATAMSDAAGFHGIGAEAGLLLESLAPGLRLAYSYHGLRPGLHLGFSRRANPREDGYRTGGEDLSWVQDITTGSLRLSAPIHGVDRSHTLSVGYSVTHARPREEPAIEYDPRGERPRVPEQFFRAGLDFGWSLGDVLGTVFGVSPPEGRTLSASLAFYHPALGGNQTLATFRYGWSEYLEVPWLDHHAFAFRLSGGVHVSDPPEGAAFSAGGYSESNFLDALMGEPPVGLPSLRGYPPGAFSGDQLHGIRLEYRFPLWWVERGYHTLPVFFRRVHGAVFTDHALISFGELDRDDWRAGVGGELVWSLAIGYFLPITIRTGYARGLMEGGTHEIILVGGSSF
jgi:hypothetical protein